MLTPIIETLNAVKAMPITDRPLAPEERAEITRQMGLGMKKIGADRAVSPTQDKLHELIDQAVASYRNLSAPLNDGTLQSLSKCLGCLWGQVVCDELGWTWALIKNDSADEKCGIVTPNRSHAIYPLHFIHDLLNKTSTEQSSIELYYRLKANQISPSSPRTYLTLGS